MFQMFYVPKVLYTEGSAFRRFHVSKVLYVLKVLCFQCPLLGYYDVIKFHWPSASRQELSLRVYTFQAGLYTPIKPLNYLEHSITSTAATMTNIRSFEPSPSECRSTAESNQDHVCQIEIKHYTNGRHRADFTEQMCNNSNSAKRD